MCNNKFVPYYIFSRVSHTNVTDNVTVEPVLPVDIDVTDPSPWILVAIGLIIVVVLILSFGLVFVMPASHCPEMVARWLHGVQNAKLCTVPYYAVLSPYTIVSSLHLRALSGAPCMHFVVRKYSLVCQRICQNNHGVASTCYLLATSVFFV